MSKFFILSEFWEFIIVRKKFWLVPNIAFHLLFETLTVLTEGNVIAPFIYAIF